MKQKLDRKENNKKSKKVLDQIFKRMYIWNVALGAYKVFLALASRSALIFIYAFYNLGLAMTKRVSKSSRLEEKKQYLSTGILVTITSFMYVIYSLIIYLNGSSAHFNLYVSIGITILTIIEFPLTIISIIDARKNNNLKIEASKWVGLATLVISISLTQTVLLSITNTSIDMSRYYAIGDILLGVISMAIGLYMIKHIIKVIYKRKKKHTLKEG